MKIKSSYAWCVFTGVALANFCCTGIIYNLQPLYIAPILEAFPHFTRASLTVTTLVQNIAGCFVVLFLVGML